VSFAPTASRRRQGSSGGFRAGQFGWAVTARKLWAATDIRPRRTPRAGSNSSRPSASGLRRARPPRPPRRAPDPPLNHRGRAQRLLNSRFKAGGALVPARSSAFTVTARERCPLGRSDRRSDHCAALRSLHAGQIVTPVTRHAGRQAAEGQGVRAAAQPRGHAQVFARRRGCASNNAGRGQSVRRIAVRSCRCGAARGRRRSSHRDPASSPARAAWLR